MHDSVYDLTHGDPRLAKALKASLTKLADGPDSPLKEMAEGVLTGHVDLRQAAMSDAYGDDIGAAFNTFQTHYDHLDQAERDHLITKTEHQLDELLDGPTPPSR